MKICEQGGKMELKSYKKNWERIGYSVKQSCIKEFFEKYSYFHQCKCTSYNECQDWPIRLHHETKSFTRNLGLCQVIFWLKRSNFHFMKICGPLRLQLKSIKISSEVTMATFIYGLSVSKKIKGMINVINHSIKFSIQLFS